MVSIHVQNELCTLNSHLHIFQQKWFFCNIFSQFNNLRFLIFCFISQHIWLQPKIMQVFSFLCCFISFPCKEINTRFKFLIFFYNHFSLHLYCFSLLALFFFFSLSDLFNSKCNIYVCLLPWALLSKSWVTITFVNPSTLQIWSLIMRRATKVCSDMFCSLTSLFTEKLLFTLAWPCDNNRSIFITGHTLDTSIQLFISEKYSSSSDWFSLSNNLKCLECLAERRNTLYSSKIISHFPMSTLLHACNTFNTLLNLSHDLSSSFLMISQGSKELRFLTNV